MVGCCDCVVVASVLVGGAHELVGLVRLVNAVGQHRIQQ